MESERSEAEVADHLAFLGKAIAAHRQTLAAQKREVELTTAALSDYEREAAELRAHRCPNGHEYTEANTKYNSHGIRRCRKCRAERQARFRAKNKE